MAKIGDKVTVPRWKYNSKTWETRRIRPDYKGHIIDIDGAYYYIKIEDKIPFIMECYRTEFSVKKYKRKSK